MTVRRRQLDLTSNPAGDERLKPLRFRNDSSWDYCDGVPDVTLLFLLSLEQFFPAMGWTESVCKITIDAFATGTLVCPIENGRANNQSCVS